MIIQHHQKFLLLLYLVISALDLTAQTGRLFTVESDLSSSLVMDIHQDRSGYIWIATEDGLNKFDGLQFTVYRQDGQPGRSILNNITRIIAEDADGRMLVGYINGLQYYNADTDEFITIPLVLHDGISVDAHVKSIHQRKNGQLLVGTSGYGIFEIVHKGGQWYGEELTGTIASDMVVDLFEDKQGALWVSTEDHGLFRFEGSRQTKYFASKEVQSNVISSIVEDNYGTVWAGSLINGLFKYDASADTFCQVQYKAGANLPIADLYVSRENRLYVATDGGGMKYVDEESGTIVDLDLPVAAFSFPKSKMNAILEDRDGNIWLSVYQKGIFMVPKNKNSFGYIGYKSVNRNFIGSNCVMSVFEDNNREIWVGTDNDGLYRLDPHLKSSKHYNAGNAPTTVMTIFEDSKQNLWVGSYRDGLAKLDRESGTFSYPVMLKDKHGADVQRIFNIVEDNYNQLWIATMGSGLFRVDLDTYQAKQYFAEERGKFKPVSNKLPNDWLNCVLISKNNKLYFGTYDGLGCLDLETESFISAFGKNRLFSDEVVYSLHDDQRGNLWVGTSKGLRRLTMSTLEITEFDVEDGLASNIIWSIEGDRLGDIWLSTNRGIAKLDVQETQFLNFYSSDGLQGDEFMRGVSFNSRGGQLFFGGLHGVSYFNPTDIRTRKKELAVHVVDFYVDNKAVRRGMKSGRFDIIDTAVNHATTFQLAYHDNSFTIEFSTMDFSDSERVVFQYSMNENEWVSLRPLSNRIAFEDLKPGTHRLRVRAVATNTISSIKEISLIIHPVWFLSSTAKVIYGCFALMLCFVISQVVKNRQRIRDQMLAHRRKEEINEAKLQFFVNIAHEVRTPLTLIVSPLKRLMGMDKEQESAHLYEIMDRNVHRMLDLVNQLMDIQKIEKGLMSLQLAQVDMAVYMREVCALFEEQFQMKDIRFTTKCPPGELEAYIDPRNFDKVLVNVLSNACKFTPVGGWIDVEVNYGENGHSRDVLTVSIADSGQQIDEQEKDRIFECFYQSTDHRDQSSGGAGIGLYLAKQLIELHGGTIRAENLREGGCRFVMTVPVVAPEKSALIAGMPVQRSNIRLRKLPVVARQAANRRRSAKRLLIADDDPDILEYLCNELSGVYNVTAVSDGGAAFQYILENEPDLIVSDIMMPKLDGFSLCTKVRSNPNVSHIPIILLTARADESDNLDGLERGADAYITKPFNIDILLKTIEGTIKNRALIKNGEREQKLQAEHISNVSIKSADDKLLEKVHLLIEKNLDNPLLSVEMISSEVGISRVHLHRKLKELTNLTTRDLIRSIRLKQAAQLIVNRSLSVSEVAYAVGYSDLSNFSVSFKQMYGVPPTVYAAQASGEHSANEGTYAHHH